MKLLCRVEGCHNFRRDQDVMCRSCWRRVALPLQRKVLELYRRARGTQEHLDAIDEAIKAARRGIPESLQGVSERWRRAWNRSRA